MFSAANVQNYFHSANIYRKLLSFCRPFFIWHTFSSMCSVIKITINTILRYKIIAYMLYMSKYIRNFEKKYHDDNRAGDKYRVTETKCRD